MKDTSVLIKCNDTKTNKEIYKNAHAFTIKERVEEKLRNTKEKRPIKILFIGIDSISRVNLMRSMPMTYEYLNESDWIEFKGYNKIGDNTYPNLMAAFTGQNVTQADKTCHGKTLGNMDECPLIWYDFNKNNFVTVYVEDTPDVATFNYQKKGFLKRPTDFYYRPYMMATEFISTARFYNANFCTGPETNAERILKIIKDFSVTFRFYATFGIFWMNSFSHNDLNNPTMIDERFRNNLMDFEMDGIYDDNIVIFLSDHGMRYGKFASTSNGWYEERLPFLHFSIPRWFREKYPEKYSNLVDNAKKLTTPYDMFMTLQDLLKMNNPNYNLTKAIGCENARSLFERIPSSRSCEDVAIPQHYCTCTSYKSIGKDVPLSIEAADYLINELNLINNRSEYASYCVEYELQSINSVRVSTPPEKFHEKYVLVNLNTRPEAVFQATLNVKNNTDDTFSFKLSGDISRLDFYGKRSDCVTDAVLKKYCYCKIKLPTIT